MRRVTALLLGGLLAALPAAGQTVIGVLGGTAQGADDAGAVVSIDSQTGAATVLGTPIAGESLTGVARLNDGRVVASTAIFTGQPRLIEIDPETGALIGVIGQFLNGTQPVTIHDLTVDESTGTLFGLQVNTLRGGAPTDTNAIFAIDPATGSCSYVGTPAGLPPGFLAIAAQNGSLWGRALGDPGLFEIDPANGALLGSVAGSGEGAMGLASLGEGTGLFLMSGCCDINFGNDIYLLDGATGVPTLLGPAGGNRRVHDLVVLPAPLVAVEVPLLGGTGRLALVLLLAVAGALLLFLRR